MVAKIYLQTQAPITYRADLYLEITKICVPTALKHKAGLNEELSGENMLIDTGPHDKQGRFI